METAVWAGVSVISARDTRSGRLLLMGLGLRKPRRGWDLLPGLEMAETRPGVVGTTLSAHQRWGKDTPSM